jgi:hypothetical protein
LVRRDVVLPGANESGTNGGRGEIAAAWGMREMAGREMRKELAAGSGDPADLPAIRAANAHLEVTIRTMRERLELQKTEAENAIQRARAIDAGEISALQATIQKMRDQLQARHEAASADLQAARAAGAAEIKQLESAVNALRARLEAEDQRHQAEVAALQSAFSKERELLREQIRALRAKLEGGS